MNNNNKKLKRIHEASKKCTNITKMERHRYILIEISALFFSKTSMLCIFSKFFRRFISVQKSQEILPRNGVNVILKNAVLINAPASAGYPPAQTVNAWSLRFHSLLDTFAFFFSDINECTSNTHSCYANATCQNTIGSHYCACMSGYTGNGQNCIGKIVALCFLVVQFCSLNKNTWSYALRATNPAINLKPMPLICWLKLLHAL